MLAQFTDKIERTRFNELFEEESNGRLSPKGHIEVNGVLVGPGVSFSTGVSIGGVNFSEIKGKDLAVERKPNGVLKIRGIYDNNNSTDE